jgi:hypothetical protein
MARVATCTLDPFESTIRSPSVHAIERGAVNSGQGSADFPPHARRLVRLPTPGAAPRG